MKTLTPVKATLLDDDAFRLLAYPFKGPIPHPVLTRGVDVDTQTYAVDVDIRPAWFKAREVDWHHRTDPTGLTNREVLGKAIDLGRANGPSDEPDEDGWWVTVWMDHGRRRTKLVRQLAEAAAASKGEVGIFGSAETMPGLAMMRTLDGKIIPWERKVPGEITAFPYFRQALSTSPQNTYSVLRPIKAVLDNLTLDENADGSMSELLADLYALGADLTTTSTAGVLTPNPLSREPSAKAGRVLSAINERALREALAKLDEVLAKLRSPDERETDASQ